MILLSILADLNNPVIWLVSIFLFFFLNSSLFRALVTVPNTPTTTNITHTLMSQSIFSSLVSPVFFPLCTFLYFHSVVCWNFNIHSLTSFSFFINTISALHTGIMRSACISKFLRILCVSFSLTDSGFCIYDLVVWSNFDLLYNS